MSYMISSDAYVRGRAARAEMRFNGYLQGAELAEKLTRETGSKVTASALKSMRSRGRIEGVFHEAGNLWFYKADTKIPEKKPGGPRPRPEVRVEGEVLILGPWASWPAPGRGGGSLGWLGGIR